MKIRAAEAKAGASPTVTRRIVEGDRYTFTSSVGYDSGAERDKWPNFGEFMGAMYSEREIQQIMEMLNGAIVSSEWYEVVRRPDLSHSAAASTSN